MPYHLEGVALQSGQSFTVDEVQYPANVLDLWSREELEALGLTWVEPEPVIPTVEELTARVDAERDRRIAGGFDFMGHRFQSDTSDRENIAALGADAAEAIRDGAQPGDYLWHPEFPQGFGFITATNEVVPLDALQMRDLRGRGIAFKAGQTFHARGLKDAIIAAEDPASIDIMDGWPA